MRNSPRTVIRDQEDYWTLAEIRLLFAPVTDHELRRIIAGNGIEAAGVRPASGRGRPPLVYPAAAVCDILGAL